MEFNELLINKNLTIYKLSKISNIAKSTLFDIASGKSKAEAIKGLFSGKISTNNPASMLQMHRDVIVIVDEEAAKLIEN